VLSAAAAALLLPVNFLADWGNHGRVELGDIPYNYGLLGARGSSATTSSASAHASGGRGGGRPSTSSGRAVCGGAPDGHGLVGMRERVRTFGGALEASPRAGGGFRVRAALPLEEATR